MREILFRGKGKEEKQWVYGGIVHQTDFYGNSVDRYFIIDGTTTQDYDIGTETEVLPDTVGQFTGLLDKNGSKIFEGDIVRDLSVYDVHEGLLERGIETLEQIEKYRYNGAVAVVEFCIENVASCGCCYPDFVGSGFKAQSVDLTCCEVIGNKWDNPELLVP